MPKMQPIDMKLMKLEENIMDRDDTIEGLQENIREMRDTRTLIKNKYGKVAVTEAINKTKDIIWYLRQEQKEDKKEFNKLDKQALRERNS